MQLQTKRRLIVFGTVLCVSATFAALQRFEDSRPAPLAQSVDAPFNVDAPPPPAGSQGSATSNAPPAGDATAKGGDGKPGDGQSAGANPEDEDKSSPDPYEGIAPEDLPPDLQFNADDSVSFPTNI
jgi:hypothetical protein